VVSGYSEVPAERHVLNSRQERLYTAVDVTCPEWAPGALAGECRNLDFFGCSRIRIVEKSLAMKA
jgi:hypothetical protein